MILHKTFYATFTTKTIADAHKTSQVLLYLSRDSRAEVDAITEAGLNAGGYENRPLQDMGFMYSRAFADLDGHTFEPMWMDASAAAQSVDSAPTQLRFETATIMVSEASKDYPATHAAFYLSLETPTRRPTGPSRPARKRSWTSTTCLTATGRAAFAIRRATFGGCLNEQAQSLTSNTRFSMTPLYTTERGAQA